MNLEELIKTRRTVHQFKNTPVSEDLVHKAMELSKWAPNHRMTLPWRYKIVSLSERQQLVDLAVELKRKKDPTFSVIKESALRSRLLAPSHWVLLAIDKNPKPDVFSEDQATLACSVQIMMLYLWQNGVATKWSSGGFSMNEKTFEILNLDPVHVHLMGMFFIGYPDVMPAPPPRS